jgi:hypothetical protein
MSLEELTPDEIDKQKKIAAEEKQIVEKDSMDKWKMAASFTLNVIVIAALIIATLNTTGDTSSRFLGMLELVLGAIFGVTATEIATSK